MSHLTDRIKRVLVFQLVILGLVLTAVLTGQVLVISVIIPMLAYVLMPVEEIKNPIIVFMLSYFVAIIMILSFRLFVAFTFGGF